MRPEWLLTIGLLAGLEAAPGMAASLSYTDRIVADLSISRAEDGAQVFLRPIDLPSFDLATGTLTGVTLALDAKLDLLLEGGSKERLPGTPSVLARAEAEAQLGFLLDGRLIALSEGAGSATCLQISTGVCGFGGDLPLDSVDIALDIAVDPGFFDLFEVSGGVPLDFAVRGALDLGRGTAGATLRLSGSASARVVYDYTPIAPVPAPGGGLAMAMVLGVVGLRRLLS